MIDVVEQINTTHRRVGPAELESGAGRTCVLSRSYDAAVEDVWDACTNPERIPRWFLPVTGELRAGGRFQLEGNAGGTISRCDPPHSFAATWEYAGDVSWIELRLSAESAERTRLELHHTVPVDNHWAQFGPGATGVGWDMGLMGLGLHISSGEAVDPQEFMAFMGSDDGREFMTLSARRWAEAHIADGADEATATAMQERTTAFYTGAEAPVTE